VWELFDGCKNAPIITDNPIATGTMIFISRLRNAEAPTFTALEISIISFVPAGCFEIQATRPAATIKEAMPAPIGKSSGISILYLHAYGWEI